MAHVLEIAMRICWLLVFVALGNGAVNDKKMDNEWQTFKTAYGRVYSNLIEEKYRKLIFVENSHMISMHNEKYLQGQSSFEMAMNEFGDMLHHEFVAQTTCLHPGYAELQINGSNFLEPENVDIPNSINWVTRGYVTPVKNQGECGSCWAFSATGGLEGQNKRKTGKLVSLSEQNLVDCSEKYGNHGCKGGLPIFAFKYIKDNNGVDTEESYPYEERDGECRFNRTNVGATDTGYKVVKKNSEKALKKAVATVGPVTVGIDASQPSFQFYSKGVYDEPDCSSEQLNHAVLIVGYGETKGPDFWLVKNSWGTVWGNGGYVRMARNKKNQCGIATLASFPLV